MQEERRYKLKRETLLRNIGIAVFFWFFLGGALYVLSILTTGFLQAKNPDPFVFIFGRLLVVLDVLIGITFLIVNITFILDFFSYIRVTQEGVEQRRSPLRYVKCKWSELEKFGKLQLIQDIILVKSPLRKDKSAETSTPLGMLLALWSPKQPFILLTGYEGWPDGSLNDALKKNAPKLFKTSSRRKGCPTQRAPDWWESARFQAVFLA